MSSLHGISQGCLLNAPDLVWMVWIRGLGATKLPAFYISEWTLLKHLSSSSTKLTNNIPSPRGRLPCDLAEELRLWHKPRPKEPKKRQPMQLCNVDHANVYKRNSKNLWTSGFCHGWRTSKGSSQRSHSQGKPNCPWMKTFRLTAHRGTRRAYSHWFQENTKFWGLASTIRNFKYRTDLWGAEWARQNNGYWQADSKLIPIGPSSRVQLADAQLGDASLIVARDSSAPHPANWTTNTRTTRKGLKDGNFLEHLKNKFDSHSTTDEATNLLVTDLWAVHQSAFWIGEIARTWDSPLGLMCLANEAKQCLDQKQYSPTQCPVCHVFWLRQFIFEVHRANASQILTSCKRWCRACRLEDQVRNLPKCQTFYMCLI